MRRLAVGALLAISLAGDAGAHRLDEYLQATLIGVTRDAIEVEIQLTPGVAVLPLVIAVIDRDRDGRISVEEERAYAARVAREVELRVDGASAPLSLMESTFPALEAMREGLGTIHLKLRTTRTGHALQFENRHLPQISAYLANCLAAPADGLVVTRQERDEAQRSIAFEYSFGAGVSSGSFTAWIAPEAFWPAAFGMLLLARIGLLISRRKSRAVT